MQSSTLNLERPFSRALFFGVPSAAWVALGALAFLGACTSVQLPPWQRTTRADTVDTPQPRSVPPAGGPGTPVLPPTVSAIPRDAERPEIPAAPYSAAVAARFPEPSIVYSTPGLQAGRTSFTSPAELRSWLEDQARRASKTAGVMATTLTLGNSQKGEAIQALLLARAAGTEAAALLANGRPTVLLVGQQRGDEPAGSEALLIIARELAQGRLQPLLERINVIIVPRANPDGAAAGQRTTSSGLDMNRDHLLLDTPEAQALARLARDYRPTVVLDAHEYTVDGRYLEKFGALQKFDALVQYATTANLPEFLTKAAEEWYRRPMLGALKAQGMSTEWYHTTSIDPANKKISMGDVFPDTSRNVEGLKNAVSLLVETRGAGIGRLHLQRRVHTHVTAIGSVLASTAQRASELSQLRPYLDKEVAAMACRDTATVQALPTAAQYELTMLDPVSGADRAITVDWDSALALRAVKTRARPCGFLISPSASNAVERLRLQGVQVMRVLEATSLLADSYREIARTSGARQDTGSAIADEKKIVKVEVALTRGVVDVAPGSYYVPLNQPLANLVLAALEPDTQSSYFANGILNNLQSTSRVMTPPMTRVEELP